MTKIFEDYEKFNYAIEIKKKKNEFLQEISVFIKQKKKQVKNNLMK